VANYSFGGRAHPAAVFYASRDRRGEHPTRHLAAFAGILQADAYSGFNGLYDPARQPAPVTSALCWAHARRHDRGRDFLFAPSPPNLRLVSEGEKDGYR
jgi:hypothetical protein